jgi:hypothetical protein
VIAQYLADVSSLKGKQNKFIFMQDNTLGHIAKEIIILLVSLAIIVTK